MSVFPTFIVPFFMSPSICFFHSVNLPLSLVYLLTSFFMSVFHCAFLLCLVPVTCSLLHLSRTHVKEDERSGCCSRAKREDLSLHREGFLYLRPSDVDTPLTVVFFFVATTMMTLRSRATEDILAPQQTPWLNILESDMSYGQNSFYTA